MLGGTLSVAQRAFQTDSVGARAHSFAAGVGHRAMKERRSFRLIRECYRLSLYFL